VYDFDQTNAPPMPKYLRSKERADRLPPHRSAEARTKTRATMARLPDGLIGDGLRFERQHRIERVEYVRHRRRPRRAAAWRPSGPIRSGAVPVSSCICARIACTVAACCFGLVAKVCQATFDADLRCTSAAPRIESRGERFDSQRYPDPLDSRLCAGKFRSAYATEGSSPLANFSIAKEKIRYFALLTIIS